MPELGFPNNPQKLVIVSEYTKLLRLFASCLRRDFGIKVTGVTGDVTGGRRDKAIEHFNRADEGPWVMMLNTKAGGASITLEADHMVILDQPPIDDDLEQVEGRIDNRNPEKGIRPRFYYYLLSEDTVDVGMANVNAYARKTGRDLLDGRRGVTYVRRVVEMSSQQPSR
jgi:SNF2 family DNA or RNA helicase